MVERFPFWENEKTCFFSNFYTNCIPVIRQVAAHCWAGIVAAPRKALLADLLRLLRILATLDGVGDRCAVNGWLVGIHPPGGKGRLRATVRVIWHMLLGHREASRAIREAAAPVKMEGPLRRKKQ